MDRELRAAFLSVMSFLNSCKTEDIPDKLLKDSYRLICELRLLFVEENPIEYETLTVYYEKVKAELNKRGILPLIVSVGFDKDGKIITGQDELRSLFVNLSFERMLKVVDDMTTIGLSEAQRQAILNFAVEKVLNE